MNRVRVWLVTVGLMPVAALPAAAQMQTGSILVRVTDEQGAAVPGVNITLTSPVLVAGTMSGVTDSRRREPLPVPFSGHLLGQDRVAGLPHRHS